MNVLSDGAVEFKLSSVDVVVVVVVIVCCCLDNSTMAPISVAYVWTFFEAEVAAVVVVDVVLVVTVVVLISDLFSNSLIRS